MSVDVSGALDKQARIMRAINAACATAMTEAAQVVEQNVLENTPTIEEEYNILMEGNGGASEVPMVNGSSYETDGRRRLIKDESTYLEPTVLALGNKEITNDGPVGTFSIGNIALLEENSRFAYQNRGHSPVEKGPYFQSFENGSLGVEIVPVFPQNKKRPYKLTPDESRYLPSMFKSTPAFNSYAVARLIPLFRETMQKVLESVSPGK